jgi:pimeloyl-ACP methyl ester carboxylesterase
MGLGYESVGGGPHAVIALHGWLGDHTAFEPILDAVDLDAYTWILPAYRGYGLSRDIAGSFTIDEVARDCLELLDRLGCERFSVVGHSMGGKAMLRMLCLAPQRIAAMIGVAPVPASTAAFDAEARALFERAALSPDARRQIVDFSTGGRLPPPWIGNAVRRSLRSAVPQAVASYFRSWADGDFHRDLPPSDVPALAVLGACDPSITADLVASTWSAWFPGIDVEVLPNCGHYPADEAPLALAARIGAFLGKALPDASAQRTRIR